MRKERKKIVEQKNVPLKERKTKRRPREMKEWDDEQKMKKMVHCKRSEDEEGKERGKQMLSLSQDDMRSRRSEVIALFRE